MHYHKTTLDNGLRIVTVPRTDAPSAAAMVLVGVGSRHETDAEAGIAHFIEHNVFKGTEVRSQQGQISEEIESAGGVMNAATSNDFTYYWAKAAASQLDKMLDVVMDVSVNMTFPERDLEIERGNVIEEINMYQDNPMSRIQHKFSEFVWNGHAVGRSTLGSKETVGAMKREQLLSFVQTNYTPERMIVVVAGKLDQERVESQVKAFYDAQGPGPAIRQGRALDDQFVEFQTAARVMIDTDETQQTHFCIGFKTFGRDDHRRFTLDLINTILGQGMSSRLFKKIREELGLAYYVGSANWETDETGLWYARAGVDNQRAEQAVGAILTEFNKLAQDQVEAGELRKGKEYLKGKTLLSVETSDDLAEWYGFQELLEKEVLTSQEYNDRIEAVTADEIRRVAGELLREDRVNLALVGPFQGKDEFEKLLSI